MRFNKTTIAILIRKISDLTSLTEELGFTNLSVCEPASSDDLTLWFSIQEQTISRAQSKWDRHENLLRLHVAISEKLKLSSKDIFLVLEENFTPSQKTGVIIQTIEVNSEIIKRFLMGRLTQYREQQEEEEKRWSLWAQKHSEAAGASSAEPSPSEKVTTALTQIASGMQLAATMTASEQASFFSGLRAEYPDLAEHLTEQTRLAAGIGAE